MSYSLKSFAFCVIAVSSLTVAPAHASIADCGNIDIDASAQCKVEVNETCKASCASLSFEAACAGKLEAGCEGGCAKLPEVSCSGSCEASCNTTCAVTPAAFDCEGNCTGTCQGTCASKCSSSSDSAQCEASCKATCTGECHGSCTGTAPTVDCAGKCQASCQGSCKADLNMDCNVQCQASGSGQCQVDLKGGCDVQCTQPNGAIFCDGEFVDNGGEAAKCITALDDYLKEHVDVSAQGTAGCTKSNNTCEAQGSATAKVNCAVSSPAGRGETAGAGLLMTALVAMGGAFRRRSRRG